MPRFAGRLIISTIGDLIDEGYSLRIFCDDWVDSLPCHTSKKFDLEELARRWGRDHGCMHRDLVPEYRCPRYGSKTPAPDTSPFQGPECQDFRDRA